jgi:hypothetical protein
MNRRRMAAVVCFLLMATSALALSGPRRVASLVGLSAGPSDKIISREAARTPRAAEGMRRSAQDGSGELSGQQTVTPPEQVIYGLLFREVAAFKKEARDREARGQDASFLRKHHKEHLKLNDDEDAALARIAEETDADVRKTDKEARKLIDKERARHPEGKLKEGEALPAPPEALGTLQRQRDARVLKGRDDLRAAVGEEAFKRLDASVRQDITAKMRPVKEDPHPEHTYRGN